MGDEELMMIEFIKIKYKKIIIEEIVKEFMKLLGVLMKVNLEEKRKGLRGMKKEEMKDMKEELKREWKKIIKMVVMIEVMI